MLPVKYQYLIHKKQNTITIISTGKDITVSAPILLSKPFKIENTTLYYSTLDGNSELFEFANQHEVANFLQHLEKSQRDWKFNLLVCLGTLFALALLTIGIISNKDKFNFKSNEMELNNTVSQTQLQNQIPPEVSLMPQSNPYVEAIMMNMQPQSTGVLPNANQQPTDIPAVLQQVKEIKPENQAEEKLLQELNKLIK